MKVVLTLPFLSLLPLALAAPSWPTPLRDPLTERGLADQLLASGSHTTDGALFAKLPFDTIVIGGGTAGLAVAARLSEDKFKRVGVIEAGPIALDREDTNAPGYFGANLGTNIDYNYKTEPGQNGVPSFGWPRGKVLGGSSALNFLVWDRASETEYNAWEELGSKGWNWKNMYKYMKKSENFYTPSAQDQADLNIQVNPADYGQTGPVQVAFPRYIAESVKKWIPALESLGIPRNNQPLAGNNRGASVQPSDINHVNSTRSYSAAAYYAPTSGRINLSVLTEATVNKIIFAKPWFQGDKVRAIGVEYVSKGKTYTSYVTREVVLSAGAVGSPQLLETSGIGSKKVLDAAGVKQIVDLPAVGENLQDHTYSAAAFTLKPGTVTLDTLRNDPDFQKEQIALWRKNEKSLYDEAVPAIGYLSLVQSVGEDESKRLIAEAKAYVATAQTPYNATLKKQIEFYEKGLGSQETISVDGYFAGSAPPVAGSSYVTFLAAQQHMLSRGSIHITSANASVYPKIQPNYFSVPFDLDVATAGLAYLRKIAGSASYRDNFIIEGDAAEYVPGVGKDLREYVKTTSTTEYHPIGTCSMLPREQGGVVDASLTVYNTQNVRVIDASVIPVHVSAHIMATIYGVAEAGAAIIKGNLKSLA